MSLTATASGAPEAKKFRLSLPTQVVVERPIFTSTRSMYVSETSSDTQSPSSGGPSPLYSLMGAVKEDDEDGNFCDGGGDDLKQPLLTNHQTLDVISKVMMFQANLLLKQQQHQHQQHQQQQQQHHHHPKLHHQRVPRNATTVNGALAVAASPAAKLFSEDDWSWHRNPAAAIRSGGTNKQTPVWKYFVYNKDENLSRCIVGDCSYMLKGPHTSTLACHLKKHPTQYAEFQKLKVEYTRDRNGGQLLSSPASSTSGSCSGSGVSSIRSKSSKNSYGVKTSKIYDSSSGPLNLSKQLHHTNHPGASKGLSNNMSDILTRLNARASATAKANGNAHLLNNPDSAALITHETNNNNNISNTTTPNNNLNTRTNIGGGQMSAQNMQNPSSSRNGDLFGESFSNHLRSSCATATTAAAPTTSEVNNNTHKWNRDERKQKEMETKLALMLSATQLPLTIIENPFFRDFIEFAQPHFSIPNNISYIEEIINTEYSKMLSELRNQLSASKRVTVMVDVLKLTAISSSASTSSDDKESKDPYSKYSDNSDSGFDVSSDENQSMPGSPRGARDETRPIIRLCVSAAYYNATAQRIQIALLGIRTLGDETNIVEAIRATVEQVLLEFDIPPNKVSRYLANGLVELISMESPFEGEIFPRMLESYGQKLTQSLLKVIDANDTIEELKKSFYGMILNFVRRQDAMELLQQIAGRLVTLPMTDSFLELTDAVLKLKDAFLSVCSQLATTENPIESMITEQQWQMLDGVSRLLRLFHKHVNVVQDGRYATIDKVVPSLIQIQLSLDNEKDFAMFGDLVSQLKDDLKCRTAFVLDMSSPDFDGSFIQATALNHHLAKFLSDEQIEYAKKAIEQQIDKRIRCADEALSRRNIKLNGGVDALLAIVTDRKTNGSNPLNMATNNNNTIEPISPLTLITSSALYSDPIMAAAEQCRLIQESQRNDERNRYAEAVVKSYFDGLMYSGNESISPTSIIPLSQSIATALNGHHLSALQFWQLYAVKSAYLADYAIELLTIPSSTLSLERIFATSPFDLPNAIASFSSTFSSSLSPLTSAQQQSTTTFDPIPLLKSIDDPERLERDVMLRFNRALIPMV